MKILKQMEMFPNEYPIKTAPPGRGRGGLNYTPIEVGDVSLAMVRYLTDEEINRLLLPSIVTQYDDEGMLLEQVPSLDALILLDILVLIDTDDRKEWERSQRSSEADEPSEATTMDAI